MIKAKQVFFWTSNLKGHRFHGDKATIFYLTSEYYSLSVLSAKLYFLEISPVHKKLSPFKVIHFSTLPSSFSSFSEMTTWTKLDIARKPISQFDFVKRFWLLIASTVNRDMRIKLLRNGIFVKSNTKHFTEFTNCNLSQRLIELALLFSMMLKSTSNCTKSYLKFGKDFSLQSLEFYSCIQFEIRKRLACWFCWTLKSRVVQPCVLKSNKPVIIWLLKTSVLSLKYLINLALVISSGDV